MLRSFQKISAIDPGFNAGGVLTVSVSTTGTRYKEHARRLEFYRQLFDRVRALPGVQSAGAINHLPLLGDVWTNGVAVEGRPETRPERIPSAVMRASCPGYFAALGIHLLQGRDFDEHDDPNAPGVAIINQTMARRLWPGESPLGKRVNWQGRTGAWLTVVGVIRDVRQWDWASEPANEMYRPLAQDAGWRAMSLVIRTSQEPLALAGAVQNQIWSLDKDLPVSHVTSMERVVSSATWQTRFWMSLLAGFAGIALLLAAVGVYGVVSYAIGQRTREIGIRMALGAHRRNVLGLVLRQSAAIAFVGALAGAAGAFALTHLMTRLLYEVSATDPAVFAIVAVLLTVVALTAAAVPAWRAARIDPVEALRYQ
jgi:putative ABC transport system permease protein